jgi:DNA primase
MVVDRPADIVVAGLAERRRLQELLETLWDITHRALLSPVGRAGRRALEAWGFPEPALDRLDIGYFPDPEFVAGEIRTRGDLAAGAAESAELLPPTWSGRVVGPWRNSRGRILTFFAWNAECADLSQRYVFAPHRRPRTPFGPARTDSPPVRHLFVVEGLLDVLLVSCYGMDDVMAIGGPIWLLSREMLVHLASTGVRELTVIPPDDEVGRHATLTILERAEGLQRPGLEVSVVDPATMAGARDLGELVRRRDVGALTEVRASRMEGDVYRLVLVPW